VKGERIEFTIIIIREMLELLRASFWCPFGYMELIKKKIISKGDIRNAIFYRKKKLNSRHPE
jgi:hypothetical protein